MTKYSNPSKKPNQYLKELYAHWKERRRLKRLKKPLPSRTSGASINECWKPSNEASKADLLEYHREEMRLRKSRRRKVQR